MARLSEEERQKRNYRVMKMVHEGFDHNQIGKELGMRPQNAKALIERLKAKVADEEIVSPVQQRETLKDATERIIEEIERIDEMIEKYESGKDDRHSRIVELIRLKRNLLNDLVTMWGIPSSIEKSAKSSPSTVSAENLQMNFGHLTQAQKLREVGDELIAIIDEERFGSSEDKDE